MHMSDALLSPAVGAAFGLFSLSGIAYSARKLKDGMDEKRVPLMGVLGAFIFAAQMVNFAVPGTGTSGHIGGGMLLAVLIGPHAAFIVIASVLAIQALFFADGGILAIGCNIWNIGIYPCFIAYPLIYKTIAGNEAGIKKITIASVSATVFSMLLGAVSVAVETYLSGRSEIPLITFLALLTPVYLFIGLIEGFVSAGVINFVKRTRPEILKKPDPADPIETRVPLKKTAVVFLVLALLTGGMASWFASTKPDAMGSLDRIFYESSTQRQENGILAELKRFQEKTVFFPDYTLLNKKPAQLLPAGHEVETGKMVSGIVGSIAVIFVVAMLGRIIRTAQKKKDRRGFMNDFR